MYTEKDLIQTYKQGRGKYYSFTNSIIIDKELQEGHLVTMRYRDERGFENTKDLTELCAVFSASFDEWQTVEKLLKFYPANEANEAHLQELLMPNFVPFLITTETYKIQFIRHKSELCGVWDDSERKELFQKLGFNSVETKYMVRTNFNDSFGCFEIYSDFYEQNSFSNLHS